MCLDFVSGWAGVGASAGLSVFWCHNDHRRGRASRAPIGPPSRSACLRPQRRSKSALSSPISRWFDFLLGDPPFMRNPPFKIFTGHSFTTNPPNHRKIWLTCVVFETLCKKTFAPNPDTTLSDVFYWIQIVTVAPTNNPRKHVQK